MKKEKPHKLELVRFPDSTHATMLSVSANAIKQNPFLF